MMFRVNEGCVGCGLCAAICPSVFEMTDEGVARAAAEPFGPEITASAEEAMSGCPAGAIEEVQE